MRSEVPVYHAKGGDFSTGTMGIFAPALTCGYWGKRTTTFWGKLHTKKHARTEYFPKSGKVYHVFSRRLYRQIGRISIFASPLCQSVYGRRFGRTPERD